MDDKQIMIDQLILFRNFNKFSDSAWNNRGLNPSDPGLCQKLELLFNECADNLLDGIKSGADSKALKRILKKGLGKFNKSDYDTEEREFICDYFFQLSDIIKIDVKADLNTWLYGMAANLLFKMNSFLKGKERILETLSQNCTKCDSKLESYILRKEEGIPDHSWFIVQCNGCKEYNLLSLEANIKEYKFGNYKSIESLDKSEFTREQALIRLEQIKLFR